jgi:hypothetical protein
MKRKIMFFLSLTAATAVMATPWRDLFFETSVCLRAAPEGPARQPEKKNNCPDYIYRAVAVIPERKNIANLTSRPYRKINPDDQIATNFFGKNKFSSPSASIGRRRKI